MRFAGFFLFAALACGQTAPVQETTVQLANAPTQQGFQEMTTVLRTVGDIPGVSFDTAHNTFALQGTAEQIGVGAWLLHAMDKPAGWTPTPAESANPSARQYVLPSGPDPVARVYYLVNAKSPQAVQELLTVLRTVGDVRKVFNYSAPRMLLFRGTDVTAPFTEWMIHELDVPADGQAFMRQNQNLAANTFKLPYPQRDGSEDITQVFYFAQATTNQQLFELIRTMRTTGGIQKVFGYSAAPALAVRGNPGVLAKVAQMIAAAN